ASEIEAGSKDASAAAGAAPPAEVAQQLTDVQQRATLTRDAVAATREKDAKLARAASDYLAADLLTLIAAAKSDISTSNSMASLAAVERKLAGASRQAGKASLPELDNAYGALYYKQGQLEPQPDQQRKLYQRAKDAYQRVVR